MQFHTDKASLQLHLPKTFNIVRVCCCFLSFLFIVNSSFAYQLKHLRRTDNALQCDKNEQHWKLLILQYHSHWLSRETERERKKHIFICNLLFIHVVSVAKPCCFCCCWLNSNVECMTQFNSGCERLLIFKWL